MALEADVSGAESVIIAAADTIMSRPTRELLAERFPDVPVRRELGEFETLLSIDRAGVRERALAAFDALGPQTSVPRERRALVTDYLLGQLPAPASEQTRARLGQSASERAWARIVASELTPLASRPLAEIPTDGGAQPAAPAPAAAAAPSAAAAAPSAAAAAPASAAAGVPPSTAAPPPTVAEDGGAEPPGARRRPSSRRGGAILLGTAALAAIVVAIVLIATGGSSKHKTAKAPASSTTASSATHVVAQINLAAAQPGSRAAGIAEVLRQGSNVGIAIVAQGVPANKQRPPNAYAVWLYNSPADSHILGFVNPGVGANGRLQTAGGLPANAGHYKQLLVTLETQANPRQPGATVLQGTLTGIS